MLECRTLSLAEIQEQEARLLQERKEREAAQQARILAQLGTEVPIKMDSAKWVVKRMPRFCVLVAKPKILANTLSLSGDFHVCRCTRAAGANSCCTCPLFSAATGNSSLADIQRQEMAQKVKSAPLVSATSAAAPPTSSKAIVANVATANSFWDLAEDEEEPMLKYVCPLVEPFYCVRYWCDGRGLQLRPARYPCA